MPYCYSTAEHREKWLDIGAAKFEACFTDKATLVKALRIRQSIASPTVLTEDNIDTALQAIDTHDTVAFSIADSERHGNVLANRFDIDFVKMLDLPPSYVLLIEAAFFYSIDAGSDTDDLKASSNFRQHYASMIQKHQEKLEDICVEQEAFIAVLDDLITKKISQDIYEKHKDKILKSHPETMSKLRQEISYARTNIKRGLPPSLQQSVHTIFLEISKRKQTQQLPMFAFGLTKILRHINETIQANLEKTMHNIDILVNSLQKLMEIPTLSPLMQEKIKAILELKPLSLLEAQSHLSQLRQCQTEVNKINKLHEYKQRYLNAQRNIQELLQEDLWSLWANRHLVFELAQTYQESDLDSLGWEIIEAGVLSMEQALQLAAKNSETASTTTPKTTSNERNEFVLKDTSVNQGFATKLG